MIYEFFELPVVYENKVVLNKLISTLVSGGVCVCATVSQDLVSVASPD